MFRWTYASFEALAIFIFVMTPQLVFFPIVRTLKVVGVDRERVLRLNFVSTAVCFGLYCAMGILGYLAANAVNLKPNPNYLLLFDIKYVIFQVCVVVALIDLAINNVFFAFACKESLDLLIFGRNESGIKINSNVHVNQSPQSINQELNDTKDVFASDEEESSRRKLLLWIRNIIESIVILGAGLALSIFIQQADVRAVAGITGASLCTIGKFKRNVASSFFFFFFLYYGVLYTPCA
jgi:hypothetical protein